MICKYCQTEILKSEDDGYCGDGCRTAETIEQELFNFVLDWTHANEDEGNKYADDMYEGVRTYMQESYVPLKLVCYVEKGKRRKQITRKSNHIILE
jgi:hypothetical protein